MHQLDVVVLVAAKVGGIHANAAYPPDCLLDNLKIETNVIENAWQNGGRRFLFSGSSCIYQKFGEQAIRTEALRRQHDLDAIRMMPTNLYEPGGNNHNENSNGLPARIRRFHEAALDPGQVAGGTVTDWDTGTPLPETLHVDDVRTITVIQRQI